MVSLRPQKLGLSPGPHDPQGLALSVPVTAECAAASSWACVTSCWPGDTGTYWIWRKAANEVWPCKSRARAPLGPPRVLPGTPEGMGLPVHTGCV